jgi:4-carboxymuconolactone decarboxylase
VFKTPENVRRRWRASRTPFERCSGEGLPVSLAGFGGAVLRLARKETVVPIKEKTMAQSRPSAARDQVRHVVPKLIDLSEKVLFGDVWERPQLSKRDRSLITCATLIALGREKQLVGHLQRALDNGVTKDEIGEIITHLAFYAGWPAAMTAALVAKDVL